MFFIFILFQWLKVCLGGPKCSFFEFCFSGPKFFLMVSSFFHLNFELYLNGLECSWFKFYFGGL